MAAASISTAELKSLVIDGNKHKLVGNKHYLSEIKPIFDSLSNVDISTKFDPKVHLAFKPEHLQTVKRTTLTELGLTSPKQISEIALSEPFPLFTDEAVDIMRAEILRKEVFGEYARMAYSSTTGLGCGIRGYAKATSPFTYEAWIHPDTVAAISAMAGVELEVIMDYEIASINVTMKSEVASENEEVIARRKSSMADKFDDNVPAVVGWHNDSYPFVCVLMLSDTSKMIGGETLIKIPTGEVIAAEGPAKGKATILQGRIVNHLASIPIGFTERITSVTSYRAKDPSTFEGSVLSTVKPEVNFGTVFNTYYPEWISYRMNLISQRATIIKEEFNDANARGDTFDKEKAFKMLKDLEGYLHNTWKEMEVSEEEWNKHKNKLK